MAPGVDVFLSYRHRDEAAVARIAQRLRGHGLSVFFDRWSLVPGEPFQPALERALRDCGTAVVFIGPDGPGGWHEKEMRAALDRQASDPDFRVIPVLLPDAARPDGFVAANTWVDFGELDDGAALEYLIAGIEGRAPGAVTTVETVAVAEQFPDISLAAFVGIEFQYASFLAGVARTVDGLMGHLYGVRVRLMDNLRALGVSAETATLLRRQLDSESLGALHDTRLAIREDLAYGRGRRVAEGFEAGFALGSLEGLLDLYQAAGTVLDEQECGLVRAYLDALAEHRGRSASELFPDISEADLGAWRDSVSAPFTVEATRDLLDTVRARIVRFTAPWGVREFRDPDVG